MQTRKRLILLGLGAAALLTAPRYGFSSEDLAASRPPAIQDEASRAPALSIPKETSQHVVKSVHEYLVLETGGWAARTLLLPQGTEPLANQAPFPVPGEGLTRPEPPVEDSPILPRRQS
jgi:hypothetical protein